MVDTSRAPSGRCRRRRGRPAPCTSAPIYVPVLNAHHRDAAHRERRAVHVRPGPTPLPDLDSTGVGGHEQLGAEVGHPREHAPPVLPDLVITVEDSTGIAGCLLRYPGAKHSTNASRSCAFIAASNRFITSPVIARPSSRRSAPGRLRMVRLRTGRADGPRARRSAAGQGASVMSSRAQDDLISKESRGTTATRCTTTSDSRRWPATLADPGWGEKTGYHVPTAASCLGSRSNPPHRQPAAGDRARVVGGPFYHQCP